ncbi:2-hydroxyacyl-CoA dehydratase [Miniphocaeibacter massiliensis]|uniref:2-hydroxyacyl-CoA dehydratase n=1 Tax=Miniphocaeibacter massiliensis TaxID=2041841 RepID=UPI000C1C7AC4|nr:2-hydroxyacyl-CoA dehydratase [Miniphocaeibacter massiliensis]
MNLHMGLDVGSTTVKLVIIDENNEIKYSVYRRHKSNVEETVREVILEAYKDFENDDITVMVTGSGGMFVEKYLDIPFIQEVVAGTTAIKTFIPETDVAIELGGEDSKITYITGNVEQRMNSICAGGTGAFIDQMASLIETDAKGLNDLAEKYEKIFPIASRCGVFAKTDIQALVNQGTSKEDIAVSVFQSVVNQTISNLACGRPIRGNIALLGGPLHFLPSLANRFIETLGEENKFIIPENSQVFVALGAAIASKELDSITFKEIILKIDSPVEVELDESNILEALFKDEEELEEFKKIHSQDDVEYGDIENYEGNCYLGIDAGSTTSKVILIDEDGKILYSHYANNKGKPLELVIEVLKEIYGKLNKNAKIISSGITGYGEDFIKSALNVDVGEVETIAHYTAAKYFDEDVDFILDIGGQDMKAMHITDGVIDSIQLNEACSSGCGSFIETFAKSLGLSVVEFQEEALTSKHPVDLGSRCTVFMNSKVKQAQKEGASVADIAAGLCYSVIKNAIQKVIKVRDPKKLGKNIVVQGGTFYGDAILRSFEKITGRIPVRPKIAGLMGAMGMALIAKEKSTGVSNLADLEFINNFSYKQKQANCNKCSNHCALSINIFSNGKRFITGNRCERGAGITISEDDKLPNLYEYKYDRLFNYYKSLPEDRAFNGKVGIPRVLNMYENYSFWHTFFTSLGYEVVLSEPSSREIYERGIDSITSETACYPAKMVHGHIEDLIDKNVRMIFYPSIFYEKQEYENVDNNINCPVVTGYPEVIKNNLENLEINEIKFKNPFLSLQDKDKLAKRLIEELEDENLDKKAIVNAVDKAWKEFENFRLDVKREGQRALEYIRENNLKAIVLAGRPYHIDPGINHGIPELILSLGWGVLSEDSILTYDDDIEGSLRVLDQWVYHSRLYRAAKIVGKSDDLELVQLNSFGCGIDAVTTDQVNEILTANGKIYTVIKIDEVSNLGAIKIRLRSLTQALKDRNFRKPIKVEAPKKVSFTKEMRKTHTILAPQMAPDHFEIMQSALESEGYNFEFLETVDNKVIDEGLKYVNNDSCYPSITVVGQMLEAVKSGRYDVDNISLLMTQTGGACRASNYVGYIRKALNEAGYPDIPVIALSAQGIENNPGFKITFKLANKLVIAILYGDLIMRVSNATRPYELEKGRTNSLKEYWIKKCREDIKKNKMSDYRRNVRRIISDFTDIPVDNNKVIPKVGIVGEILVKYLPEANNNLQEILENEGTEVVLPDLMDFLMYCLRNTHHKTTLLSKGKTSAILSNAAVKYVEYYRSFIRSELKKSKFHAPLEVTQLEDMAETIVSLGNQYGEGWLLTAEMIELIEDGANNIVCIQPFGCLPNHITGKGVIKRIRELHPEANIIPIDYDPGASEVNQVNRIKLMLSQANEILEKQEAIKKS